MTNLKWLTLLPVDANGTRQSHIENGSNIEVVDEHHESMIGYEIVSYDTPNSNATYPVEVDRDGGKYIPEDIEEVEFNGNKYKQVATWIPLT